MGITVRNDLSGQTVGGGGYASGRENRRRSDVQVGIQYAGLAQRQQQIDYSQFQDQRNFNYQIQQDQVKENSRQAELQFRAYTQQAGFDNQQRQADQLQKNRLDLQQKDFEGRIEVDAAEFQQEEAKLKSTLDNIQAQVGGMLTQDGADFYKLQEQTKFKLYPREVAPLTQTEIEDSLVQVGPNGIIPPDDKDTVPHGFYSQTQDDAGKWRVTGFVNTQRTPDRPEKADPSIPSYSDHTARNTSRAAEAHNVNKARGDQKLKYLQLENEVPYGPVGEDGEQKTKMVDRYTREEAAALALEDFPLYDRSDVLGGEVGSRQGSTTQPSAEAQRMQIIEEAEADMGDLDIMGAPPEALPVLRQHYGLRGDADAAIVYMAFLLRDRIAMFISPGEPFDWDKLDNESRLFVRDARKRIAPYLVK